MDLHALDTDTGHVYEFHTDAGPQGALMAAAVVIPRPEQLPQGEAAAQEVSEGYRISTKAQDSDADNKAAPAATGDTPATADSSVGLEAPDVTEDLEPSHPVDTTPKKPVLVEHDTAEEGAPLPSPLLPIETQHEEPAVERVPDSTIKHEIPPSELPGRDLIPESAESEPESAAVLKPDAVGPARAVAVRYPLPTVSNALSVMQGCLMLAQETLALLPPELRAQLEGMEFLMEPAKVMHQERKEEHLDEVEAPQGEAIEPEAPPLQRDEFEGVGPEEEEKSLEEVYS